jgi:hypothetical protein
LWEERDEGPEAKSSWKKIKSNHKTFDMLRPGILEKVMKHLSVRTRDPQNE